MKYVYKMFDEKILIDAPFKFNIKEESSSFMRIVDDENFNYSYKMVYQPTNKLIFNYNGGHWMENRYYTETDYEEIIYFTSFREKPPYAYVVNQKNQSNQSICYYEENKVDELNYSLNFTNMLGIETLLSKKHGFMLHSSFIKWKNKGILFSAPSGTGKSTQADLWAQYENAEIINGDKAGVRKVEGKWKVYGLPHAGTSGIYKNKSADLNAIIILRQAKENNINKLNLGQAISLLYQECFVHRWDKEFVERILDTLQELAREIPIYLLQCKPDQGAVNLVKSAIIKEKEGMGKW